MFWRNISGPCVCVSVCARTCAYISSGPALAFGGLSDHHSLSLSSWAYDSTQMEVFAHMQGVCVRPLVVCVVLTLCWSITGLSEQWPLAPDYINTPVSAVPSTCVFGACTMCVSVSLVPVPCVCVCLCLFCCVCMCLWFYVHILLVCVCILSGLYMCVCVCVWSINGNKRECMCVCVCDYKHR